MPNSLPSAGALSGDVTVGVGTHFGASPQPPYMHMLEDARQTGAPG